MRMIQQFEDDPFQRKPRRTLKHRIQKLDTKIHKGIASNGLYRIRLNTNQKAQNDDGANCSVMNLKHLLLNYKDINPYPIEGVNTNETAIHCTGIGFLPWESNNGEIILVKCYYCKDVDRTILSPTDIVSTNSDRDFLVGLRQLIAMKA